MSITKKFKLSYINGNEIQVTYRWGLPLSDKFCSKLNVSRNELMELRKEIDEFIDFYKDEFTEEALSVIDNKIELTDNDITGHF